MSRFFALLVAIAGFALVSCAATNPDPPDPGAGDEPGASSSGDESAGSEPEVPSNRVASCPAIQESGEIPNVSPAEETLEYWLARTGAKYDLDEVLMPSAQVDALNAVNRHPGLGYGPISETEFLQSELQARLNWLHERLADGRYVTADGAKISADELAFFEAPDAFPAVVDEVRVALELTPLRCGPRVEGFFKGPDVDTLFDRNNCSTIHAQEPVQILAEWPNGMRYARTRYASGWLAADAKVSPPLPDELRGHWTSSTKSKVTGGPLEVSSNGTTSTIPNAAFVPAAETGGVHFATANGFHVSQVPAGRVVAGRALTRRALLEEAFGYIDQPYGWGGEAGGRDCSRFLLDLFASFGVEMPRVSSTQAKSGTFSIDLAEVESEEERLLLIDAAAEHGAVLLQMPGHIMLYLGRNDANEPRALHSFSEYLVPCSGQPKEGAEPADHETLVRVNRVTVSDLELGRDSTRTAFIQRLTKITVVGQAPRLALRGAATMRASAPVEVPGNKACKDSQAKAFFYAPHNPNSEQPLKVIFTASDDPGIGELVLVDPSGEVHRPEVRELGGPPFTKIATIEQPADGTWKVVHGDGERVDACLRIRVRERPTGGRVVSTQVWPNNRRWTEATENLYSAYVESLFDYPADEDVSWNSFHAVLKDPERNLFFDHHGVGETGRHKLIPDCADMPYFVRAYFAWNMGLPMGYRRCSRGKAGRPPRCNEDVLGNQEAPSDSDAHKAFGYFMNRRLRNVHSGSGRTAPGDDNTDFYAVPLTREALRPGTLYADPDGHLMMISKWVPQTATDYGVLIAADAQPDGTVGRRRFWRGSFLFTPDTTNVGAGFKAFRPITHDSESGTLLAMTNAELDGSGPFVPYSEMQYEGSKDDFYDRMDSLINPRPLDPFAMQVTLIDALDEQVARRVQSVNNGIEYVAEHPSTTIEMPTGYSIFETKGAWEDFSTPSRDMRLLIAMDAVTGFSERVRRAPERYGFSDADADAKADELAAFRDDELSKRAFEYTRSDKTTWSLTLADVIARSKTFEVSYNPNDCPEIRWAAPRKSDEYAPCDRHAPKAQTERMETYRTWFSDRQRPPR